MPVRMDNSMAAKGFLLSPLVLLLAACTAGNGEGLDEDGQAETTFQEIQQTVFTPICTQCHIGATAPVGLRLDAANSYALLVNVASVEVPGLMRVNPGNPDQSYLVQKIQGNAAVGARMPLGQAPLPQDRIDLIRQWIAEGAPRGMATASDFTVASVVPERGKLTVIFSGDVDATLAASGTFELRDGFDQEVPLTQVRVPEGRPNVVEITPAQGLEAGSYQLAIHGASPVALADNAGRVLDGDADGAAGGDHLTSFDISAGATR